MAKFICVLLVCVSLASVLSLPTKKNEPAKTEQIGVKENNQPKTILNFQLSANNIADEDGFGAGESDPFVKVYHDRGGSWTEFGRSETIVDNLNPTWGFVFTDAGYVPGAGQKYWIEIRDHDAVGVDDEVGDAEILVDDYFNDADKIITVSLLRGGSVTIKQAVKKPE